MHEGGIHAGSKFLAGRSTSLELRNQARASKVTTHGEASQVRILYIVTMIQHLSFVYIYVYSIQLSFLRKEIKSIRPVFACYNPFQPTRNIHSKVKLKLIYMGGTQVGAQFSEQLTVLIPTTECVVQRTVP